MERLESRYLLSAQDLVISEFMASNDSTLQSANGGSPDWAEIWNSGDEAIDLQGFHLTDNLERPNKWTFPSVVVEGGGYLLVMLSGEESAGDELHASFKLNADGEALALVGPDNNVLHAYGSADVDFPAQSTDVSYGVLSRFGVPRFFASATPGQANESAAIEIVADTKFSVDRGFFNQPFTVEITSATPGATIAFTVDGSEPSPEHGQQIATTGSQATASVQIQTTTTLRAMAYKEGGVATNVDTQTYLFLSEVVRQSGEQLPDTWGHAGADYAMDPDVVDDPLYEGIVVHSLAAVPSLSLVTEQDNWFATGGQGIYPQGTGSERAVSVEWLDADGEGFQIDGSVEIQGGSSTQRWKSDKLSMQLKFKQVYGPANLEFPLFGPERAQQFDTLVLDARLNQAWHYGGRSSPDSQRNRAQYTRDQFVSDLQEELGGLATAGQHVHLYLNGIYWGLYNLHERPDEHFATAYLGGSEGDYDVIKHNTDVVNGTLENYTQLHRWANRDLAESENYERVASVLAIDEFINYMLLNFYVGNEDWAHHNWYATFNRVAEDGQWRFHSWDAEHSLKGTRYDATGKEDADGPTRLHRRLMLNAEYRLRFIDLAQAALFEDGPFTPDRAAALYQVRTDAVFEAVVAESARWGDNHRRTPFTRDVEWIQERDRLMQDYFPQRTEIVIQQLQSRGMYPDFPPPTFVQGDGSAVELKTRRGMIVYTLDGSEPSTSPTAREYTEPVVFEQSTQLRARVQVGDEWSAVLELSVGQVSGDFNGDTVVDLADLDLLYAALPAEDDAYDQNGDSQLNEDDIWIWVEQRANKNRGDVNLDGRVEFADFLILSSNFGGPASSWSEGDLQGDGVVDFTDFLVLSANFGDVV